MDRTLRLARQLLEHRRYRLVNSGRVHQAKTVTAAAPGQGPYYWVLGPDSSWKLWAYVVGREDNVPDHSRYWKEIVAPHVAELWGKTSQLDSIKRYPYGFPRGRVSYFDKIYYLNHGGDAPEPDWKERILSEYNLRAWAAYRPNQTKIFRDSHEKMLAHDQSGLMGVLGISLISYRNQIELSYGIKVYEHRRSNY